MDSNFEKFRNTRFFGSLDGLRAISIIGVIWYHTWADGPNYPRLLRWPVLRQGGYGVHIFFTVSGFLITTLLLRERDRFGTISLRDFYIRRALRIWPLYYAVLGLYLVNALYFEKGTVRAHSFLHYLPAFATFTYTWFVSPNYPGGMFNLAWTLASEEQFYFFWPFVQKILRGIWPVVVVVGIIGLVFATNHGLTAQLFPPGWLRTRIVTSIMPPICFGVLLAEVLHSRRGFDFLYRILGQRWSAPVMLAGMCVALWPQRAWLTTAWIFTCGLVGACVVREENGLASLLRLRPMVFIGTLSYGMYLMNSFSIHAMLYVCKLVGFAYPPVVFAAALALATGLAYLSFRFYESPFLALKTRFSRLRPDASDRNPGPAAIPDSIAGVHP